MKIKRTSEQNKVFLWFLLLFLLSIAIRIFIILVSYPGIQNDSPSYLTLAHEISQLNLINDSGFRTPVYPLFILFFNFDPVLIRIGQTILGLLILSSMYWMSWYFTRNILIAFITGALYGFNLAQIYFESNVLTETLATFFVVTSVFIFIIGIGYKNQKRYFIWMLGSGLLGAVAALTRPLYIFVPFLLALINYFLLNKNQLRKRILWSFVIFLPAFILIGGWSLFNYLRLGYLGPTTFTGYGLADHSITFIQYAPEQFGKIRDVFLDLRVSEGTNVINVWDGYTQMEKVTGESFVQISKTLTQMSLYLFFHHPILYAQSIIVTWIRFWNEPGWWTWPFIYSEKVQLIIAYAWRIEKYFLVIMQNTSFLLFVTFSTILTIIKRSREGLWKYNPVMIMTSVILITSIVQAIMERGDVTRYAIPIQPLIAYVLLISLWQILTDKKTIINRGNND
jgi:4-amino-4-deoxy-L-arabinose transferase-like glycosyltransferase